MPEPELSEITHETQVTPAHVYQLVRDFRDEVNTRLDRVEGTIRESGLNGHTPYLKAFLEQYAATYVSQQAWQTVRADIAHRLRFLSSPRAWLRVFVTGVVGAFAWQVGAQLFHVHITFPFL